MWARFTCIERMAWVVATLAALFVLSALAGARVDAAAAQSLMVGITVADGGPSLPDQPPTVPTPDPDANTWRLRLGAFPDTVGVGGYACPGCDGVFAGGDQVAAAGRPLQPIRVVVTEPGNPDRLYWIGMIDRSAAGRLELADEIALHVPPPYEVRLLTVNPVGYRVCPNSRPVFILTQDDFDAVSGGRPGSGRNLQHNWFFWSCRRQSSE